MKLEEWIVSLLLIAVVIRQIRGKPLTLFSLTWPIFLVLVALFKYINAVPFYKPDWFLVLSLILVGLILGIGCGSLTQVYVQNKVVIAKAKISAAILWILGMSSRILFGLYVTHGGGTQLAQLSNKLQLHSYNTWGVSLIFMALLEVLSRSFILYIRYRNIKKSVINNTGVE